LSKQQEGNFGSRTRKKRRRGKEEPGGSDVKDRLHEITEDSRENEIMGKRDRSPRKRSDSFSKLRPKNREARKSRAERRRRKKDKRKERNRESGKDTRRNDRRQDVARRKRKRKTHDGGLSGRVLDKLDLAGTNTSEVTIENSSSFAPDRASLTEAIVTTTSSSLQRHPTLETTRRLTRTTPRRGVYAADTVEREFSKQLEMEISKSALKDSSILDEGIFDTPPKKSTERNAAAKEVNGKSVNQDAVASLEDKIDFKSSHYDAERMLGYSRTEEDLPILDLENEVLERTLKDYNAYMTSRLKPLSLPRYDELPIRRSSNHPPRKPIINSEESVEEIGDGNTEVTDVTGAIQDDSSTKGDLSCINGTFLPAPLSRHALIKYVK